MDGEAIYFGPGSDTLNYLDPRTGQRREFRLADVVDCIRVCDALDEIGFVMSVGVPRDVPEEYHYRYQFAAMLRSTAKPIVVVCDDLADMKSYRWHGCGCRRRVRTVSQVSYIVAVLRTLNAA